MKLKAQIAGTEHDLELRFDGGQAVVDIDDRHYEIQVRANNQGYLLIHNAAVFDCRVEGRANSGETLDVYLGTNHYPVMLVDPKRLRGAASAGGHADGAARIIAPMPGKVVRILVEQGASVEAGAGVVVVEAMKMQNEMKSPKAGTIVSMNVEVGATVNGGDVLAVIE